ncbi:hypothetical protein D3C76_629160 [compost metagenome]
MTSKTRRRANMEHRMNFDTEKEDNFRSLYTPRLRCVIIQNPAVFNAPITRLTRIHPTNRLSLYTSESWYTPSPINNPNGMTIE